MNLLSTPGRSAILIASILMVAGLSWFTGAGSAQLNPDEIWFVQVLNRMLHGEVLYRDISFGASPLSLYITWALALFFGAEVMLVRAVTHAAFVLAVLACCYILKRLGAQDALVWLLALAIIVCAPPTVGAAYSPLALVFLLLSFAALLQRRVLLCGLFAGLAFATKQNVGIYILIAAAIIVAFIHRTPRRIIGLIGAFLLAVFACLAPVWLSGGWAKFVEYGFIGKSLYLRAGSLSYWDHFHQAISDLQWVLNSQFVIQWIYVIIFLLPLAPLLLLPLWRREPATSASLFLFALVGLMSVYPRPDISHMKFAVPLLLLVLAYAASCLNTRGWVAVAAILLCLGTVARGWAPLSLLLKSKAVTMQASHFHWMPVLPERRFALENTARRLTDDSRNHGPAFLLFGRAAIYYLLTGIRNPTPFDYPLVTTFGLTGMTGIENRIAAGTLRNVCVAEDYPPPLNATELIRYVEQNMTLAEDFGECRMYRSKSTPQP